MRLPTWVGDVVMATSTLAALRARFPGAAIAVEGKGHVERLLVGLPCVDAFLVDPGGRWWPRQRARARAIADFEPDVALLLPESVTAATAPFLARVPRRVGYARDPLRRWLLTDALPAPKGGWTADPMPMPERYMVLARVLGCEGAPPPVSVALHDDARARVDARLAALGLGGDGRAAAPFLVASPGASFGSSKLYPPDQFATACDLIGSRLGLSTVIAPGPGEEALARDVAARMARPAAVLADPVESLDGLTALLARARLLFVNDTGPRHIAVALGVPVVTVMGSTDPRHTDYQLERQRVLREPVDCSPCHLKTCPIDHRCMTRLAPQRVAAAAAELLGAGAVS